MILLSLLIPTVKRHNKYLHDIRRSLGLQMIPYSDCIEILVDDDENDNVGAKRNRLLERANGKYLAFIDSDDRISGDYISLVMEGVSKDVDCCSLVGEITFDGINPKKFVHSLQYDSWFEDSAAYYRSINHLNCVRSSIAKQIKFPEKSYGEDYDFSIKLKDSNLLKTEHKIEQTIYHYDFISDKTKTMLYSQSDEQLFIEDYFLDKPVGKFIDIGVYHVFMFSNTRWLYEKGFSGILVEPQPANYKAIAEHYKDDDRIKVLNVAIGAETGEIDFYESDGDAVGTTDVEHMQKWGAAGVKYTKIKVKQLSVEALFNLYGKDCDMLSLDTESTNVIIFRLIPDWFWERVKLVVIEHDGFQDEIENKLSSFGFGTLYTNAENILLAKP